MTILAYLLGALAAAAGTRLAAAGFIAAAALAAMDGGPMAAVVTWTSALAAGFVLLERASVRHLAIPALGSAAVLAAALASNGAVVLALWVLGTACAILAGAARPRDSEPALRWALALCLLDLPVVAAISAASTRGFEGWPLTLENSGSILLLGSALLRATLAAGHAPENPGENLGGGRAPGLLIVRAQALVLATFAILAGGDGLAEAAVLIGCAGFAAAVLASRPQITDVVQEVCLYTVAAAASSLAWTTQGWGWGALAAGTLIHHLRLMVGRGTAGQWADTTLKSAGIGLPFLPVVASLLIGASGVRGWTAVVLALGLLAGTAGRTRVPVRPSRRQAKPAGLPILEDIRGASVVVMAVVASLWAGASTLPRAVGGNALGWPPAWAVVATLLVGAAGGCARGWVAGIVPARRRATTSLKLGIPQRLQPPALPASERALWAALGVLALAGCAMWIVGLTRGFL